MNACNVSVAASGVLFYAAKSIFELRRGLEKSNKANTHVHNYFGVYIYIYICIPIYKYLCIYIHINIIDYVFDII